MSHEAFDASEGNHRKTGRLFPTGPVGTPHVFDGVAAAVLDDRGTVLRWTGTARDLTGFAAEEVCGRSVPELLAGFPGEVRSVTDGPTSGQVRLGRREQGEVPSCTARRPGAVMRRVEEV
ncbi:PAS domain-containing protein [Streptomyces sp. NPDC007856]|uniref:PAS domain-containing protein n=1 Tax=Streptomyces sp. NPDC007856 TaxID=3364781 RepID=UPI0036A440AF